MQTKEKPYEDREVEIRGETCKLSELSKEERDIYFAGYYEGHDNGSYFMTCVAMGLIIFIAIVIAIINH